ncbi:MAG: glycoside hydrolase [Dysgonamonadaceae bacterium]|nr:glycoside hydrolase [Dysgonamonadaceae bacterium]
MIKRLLTGILIILFYLGMPELHAQAFDTSIPNKYVAENKFLTMEANMDRPPAFETIKLLLPEPYWPVQSDVIQSYWQIWELEFSYAHQVTKENKFVSPYIEPPFNGHIFMWDACFQTLFGKYGHRAFNFQGTLDNFYCKQHKDGFISREISIATGLEHFEKWNVSSTGPNLIPWSEWEYFLNFNDTVRLKNVFPPLLAYYQWYRTNRSWPDGSYFSSGWGSGMDNQPRLPEGKAFDPRYSNGFMSWIDITLQQIFVGKILIQMAGILDRTNDIKDIETEIYKLTEYVQKNMWDNESAFFYDRYRDGALNHVKSIAAFWSLLAGVIPVGKTDEFIGHLENPKEFARTHRVPTLSADHPSYDPVGGYWCGPIWAPTNYMVLSGLTKYGKDSLAHEIAFNHVTNVAKVYTQTGTFWETYAADAILGSSMKDFVDWNGLIPINDLFEYVFGIRPDVPANTLLIDVRLKDEYGIKRYPFGKNGLLDILCEKRKKETDKPAISIQTNVPLKIIVKWKGGELSKDIKPGKIKL